MSIIVTELSIRNVTREIEVTLTGDVDCPTIDSVTLCDGCIKLDVETLYFLMGNQEWSEFVSDLVEKRDAEPLDGSVYPIGRSLNDGH